MNIKNSRYSTQHAWVQRDQDLLLISLWPITILIMSQFSILHSPFSIHSLKPTTPSNYKRGGNWELRIENQDHRQTENMKAGQLILPWKTRITCFILSAVTDFSMRSNGVLNRRFLKIFEINAKVPLKPPRDLKITDVTVDPTRNLWFRLFVPTQEEEQQQQQQSQLPVMIFFHGGGFAYLSADSFAYDVACRRFARESQIIVVSVNYRLSPEHRYPSQYEDGFDVLKFLDERTCEDFPMNADLSRCFLAGDSAGGNLAHHVACRFAASGNEMFREVNVSGLITIQPWFGGEERTEAEIRLANAPLVSLDRTDWLWKAFLPEGCDRDHEAINVFGPNSCVEIGILNKKFPATLVVIGGFDPLQDWQRRYYDGLKTSGKEVYLVEYPNAIHAFYIFPELADTPALFAEVKKLIQNH